MAALSERLSGAELPQTLEQLSKPLPTGDSNETLFFVNFLFVF